MSKKTKFLKYTFWVAKKKEVFSNVEINRNLLILACLFLIATMIGMLFMLSITQDLLVDSYKMRRNELNRYSYWREKAEEFPNAPDVLYNAALYSLNLGRYETALKFIGRAEILDPEFKGAKKLREEVIQKRAN